MDNISENNIKDTFLRYNQLTSFEKTYINEYYRRKENFGSMVYDHLFIKLGKIINELNSEDLKVFKKNILNCHYYYLNTIEINKPKFELSSRVYKISNFYSVLYYEIFITKILNNLSNAIKKSKSLTTTDLLQDGKYFGFAHRIDILKNDFSIENYQNGWLDFLKKKDNYESCFNYYISFDIVNFYDSIRHEDLVTLLKYFFDNFSNFNDIDLMLSDFQDALFKVNCYNDIGIPQGLLGSDILSTIYMWIIFLKNKNNLKINFDKGEIVFSEGLKLIYYADDFIIFGNNPEELEEKFYQIKKIFASYGLKLHGYNPVCIFNETGKNVIKEIDIEKLKSNDNPEIEKLKNYFLRFIDCSMENIEDFQEIKTYFKWIKKLEMLSDSDKKKFYGHIRNSLFGKELNAFSARKNFLLLSISVKNYLFLIKKLIVLNGLKEEQFLKVFKKYGYMLSDGTFEVFCLHSHIDGDLILINFANTLMYNFGKRKRFTNLQYGLLKSELLKQNLKGLENCLYGSKKLGLEEDILGLKLHSLFLTDKNYTTQLGKYIYNLSSTDKKLSNFLIEKSNKLFNITDSLISIKNTKPTLFLEDSGFLSDIYSLFNILLTIYYSILHNKQSEIKISGTEVGQISGTTNRYIEDIATELGEFKNILFYITKMRAKLNHKESFEDWESNVNVFNQFKNKDILFVSIKDTINSILSMLSDIIISKTK